MPNITIVLDVNLGHADCKRNVYEVEAIQLTEFNPYFMTAYCLNPRKQSESDVNNRFRTVTFKIGVL